nr:phospholipid-transporting ATPase 2 [Ipomoea batatas]
MFRSDLNLTIVAPSSKSKHHSRTIRRRHLQSPNTIAAPSAVAAPPVDTATPPSTASAQPLHSVASRPRLKPSRRCTPSLLSTSRRVATAPRRWSPSPHSTANADLRHSTPRHHSTANSVHLVFCKQYFVNFKLYHSINVKYWSPYIIIGQQTRMFSEAVDYYAQLGLQTLCLEIIGVAAIEDKLQDGVSKTIETLRKAGISL